MSARESSDAGLRLVGGSRSRRQWRRVRDGWLGLGGADVEAAARATAEEGRLGWGDEETRLSHPLLSTALGEDAVWKAEDCPVFGSLD